MEEDYDIGHSIRTSLIPEAVLWYTGEAMEDDGDDEDDEVRIQHTACSSPVICSVKLCIVLRLHMLNRMVMRMTRRATRTKTRRARTTR